MRGSLPWSTRAFRALSLFGALAGLAFCASLDDTNATDDDPASTSGSAASEGGGTVGSGTSTGAGSGSGGSARGGCLDGDPFAVDALMADVAYLASDELEGRLAGTPGDELARAYLVERLTCLGLAPGADGASYQQPFVNSIGQATANVIALVAGADPVVGHEIILVGAHHDHLGIEDGEIHNGANDDASGVAALMAVAKGLKQRASPPRRTIVLAAFGSEENELDGSYHFVDVDPPEAVPIDDIVHMVNLDMVGTYALAGVIDAFGTYDGTPGLHFLEQRFDDYPMLDFNLGEWGYGASDYDDFCEVGIPYLYFETWDDDCYHAPCDDPDHLDYDGLSAISRLSFDLVTDLADTDMDLAAAREAVGCDE